MLSLGNVKVVKTEPSGKVSEHVCNKSARVLCVVRLVLNQAATFQFEDGRSVCLSIFCIASLSAMPKLEVAQHGTCVGKKLKHDAQRW